MSNRTQKALLDSCQHILAHRQQASILEARRAHGGLGCFSLKLTETEHYYY